VLQLAQQHAFARKLVNSGRLSVPAFYSASSLNTPDADAFDSPMVPGAPIEDAPVVADGRGGWLIDQVGNRFQLLVYVADPAQADRALLASLRDAPIPVEPILVSPEAGEVPGVRVLQDAKGLFAARYDARDGSAFLLRPDQHLAARWRGVDAAQVRQAVARATCNA
jgi:3-(3-hydroxy-phenyl)propionate hydroxylase